MTEEQKETIDSSCLDFLMELSSFFDNDFFSIAEIENYRPKDYADDQLGRYDSQEEAIEKLPEDFFYLNELRCDFESFFDESQKTSILSRLQETPIFPTILEVVGIFEWMYMVLGEASVDILCTHHNWKFGKITGKNTPKQKVSTEKAYRDCQKIIMSVAKKIIKYQFARKFCELGQKIEFYCKINSDPETFAKKKTEIAKKRGKGILETQVADLLERLKWPVDIKLPEIKEILDLKNCKKHKPTNVRAIRDTEAWKDLQERKASAEAKG